MFTHISEWASEWLNDNYTHIYKSQILRMLKSYSAAAKFQYTKPKICEITGFRFFQMPAVISCFLAIDVKLGCADMFSWNWIHLLAWLLILDCIIMLMRSVSLKLTSILGPKINPKGMSSDEAKKAEISRCKRQPFSTSDIKIIKI